MVATVDPAATDGDSEVTAPGGNGADLADIVADQAEGAGVEQPDNAAHEENDAGGEAKASPPNLVRTCISADDAARSSLLNYADMEARRRSVAAVETVITTSPRPTRATAAHGIEPALLPSPDGTECGAADELVPTSYV